jgi:hypothetical protein
MNVTALRGYRGMTKRDRDKNQIQQFKGLFLPPFFLVAPVPFFLVALVPFFLVALAPLL